MGIHSEPTPPRTTTKMVRPEAPVKVAPGNCRWFVPLNSTVGGSVSVPAIRLGADGPIPCAFKPFPLESLHRTTLPLSTVSPASLRNQTFNPVTGKVIPWPQVVAEAKSDAAVPSPLE